METQGATPPEAQKSLYKERITSTDYLNEMLKQIDTIRQGEGVLDLSESERSLLFEQEAELESELLKYWRPTVRSLNLDINYLGTEEGRASFAEKTGLPEPPPDASEIQAFLYMNTDALSRVSASKRKILSGECDTYRDKQLLNQFKQSVDDEGVLTPPAVEYDDRIGLVLDPEKWVKKNADLRAFKQKLKEQYRELDKEDGQLAEAKKLIINMYLTRVNISIVGLAAERRMIARKASDLGLEALTPAEREMLGSYDQWKIESGNAPLITDPSFREKQAARLDKFSYGASHEYNEGDRVQVGQELAELAEKYGSAWLEATVEQYRSVESKGLDPKLIFRPHILAKDRKQYVEDQMASLGILSSYRDYDPDRSGAAPDRKFQVYIKPGRMSASVVPRRMVQVIADKPASVADLWSIDAGHEFTHVLQAINATQIPLKIFGPLGGGSAIAFSEGGAMQVERKITNELFGYDRLAPPHYIRAMSKKIQGGNYPEVVSTFFNGAMEPYRILRSRMEISDHDFKEKIEHNLKLAINRCQRIFRGSTLDSEGMYLTRSAATAYLEQNVLFERLSERGLDKLFLIRGMSLENIVTLMKLGLLGGDTLAKLVEPNYDFITQEWQKQMTEYEITQ